jgi:hypothetical protein
LGTLVILLMLLIDGMIRIALITATARLQQVADEVLHPSR